MALGEFCRLLADRGRCSIVVEEKLDAMPVTLEVTNEEVAAVLGVVARRLGVQLTRVGNLYFVGTLRPEDKGVLVRRVARLDREGLAGCVGVLLSEFGRCQTFADGLVVVGDRVEVLQRVQELLDQVERAEGVTWVAQVVIVSLSKAKLREFGIEGRPTIDLSATFAAASASSPTTALAAGAALAAVVRASAENRDVTLEADPLLLVGDGAEATFSRGRVVPVPRKAVSNQGTVSTTGFQQIQTGLEVKIGVREFGGDTARAKLEVSDSTILEMVEGAPVVEREALASDLVIRSGGVYLVGSLRRAEAKRRRGLSDVLGLHDESSERTAQVWLRVFRIAGPTGGASRE